MLANPPSQPRRRQGLFTAAGNLLFCAGLVLLFWALYHEGSRGAVIASAVLFLGTLVCWRGSAASASAE